MLWLLICFCVLSIDTDVVYGKIVKRHRTIRVHKILSTWEEANDHCQREGLMLASPINGNIINAMRSLMSVDNMYHIGIRAGHSLGTYLSLEGVPLENMTEAMDHMIEGLDPLSGDCMAMDKKTIRFIPCWTRLQHLCYNINDINIDCDKEDCCGDKGYKYQSSSHKCYKVSENQALWSHANYTCFVEGGRLAIVEDENDKQSILKMNVLQHQYLFIGLRDATGHGDWMSIDGRHVEELYNNWCYGHIPIADPNHVCGVMVNSGTLLHANCNSEWPFICEKDITI